MCVCVCVCVRARARAHASAFMFYMLGSSFTRPLGLYRVTLHWGPRHIASRQLLPLSVDLYGSSVTDLPLAAVSALHLSVCPHLHQCWCHTHLSVSTTTSVGVTLICLSPPPPVLVSHSSVCLHHQCRCYTHLVSVSTTSVGVTLTKSLPFHHHRTANARCLCYLETGRYAPTVTSVVKRPPDLYLSLCSVTCRLRQLSTFFCMWTTPRLYVT